MPEKLERMRSGATATDRPSELERQRPSNSCNRLRDEEARATTAMATTSEAAERRSAVAGAAADSEAAALSQSLRASVIDGDTTSER